MAVLAAMRVCLMGEKFRKKITFRTMNLNNHIHSLLDFPTWEEPALKPDIRKSVQSMSWIIVLSLEVVVYSIVSDHVNTLPFR